MYKYAYQASNPSPNSSIACIDGNNCTGPDEKCVNGYCQKGSRINLGTSKITSGPNAGKWVCAYYYKWSDGSTNPAGILDANGNVVQGVTPLSQVSIAPCDITQ